MESVSARITEVGDEVVGLVDELEELQAASDKLDAAFDALQALKDSGASESHLRVIHQSLMQQINCITIWGDWLAERAKSQTQTSQEIVQELERELIRQQFAKDCLQKLARLN